MNKHEAIEAAYAATGTDWQEQTWRLAIRFAVRMRVTGEKWTAEDMRRFCHDRGLPVRKGQAFGAILQGMARDGVIMKAGYTETSNPNAHSRLVAVWRSL